MWVGAGESQLAYTTPGWDAIDAAINGPCASRQLSAGPNKSPRLPPRGKAQGLKILFRSKKKFGRGQGIATHCYHKGDTWGPRSLRRYLCTGLVWAVAVHTVTHAHDVEHE